MKLFGIFFITLISGTATFGQIPNWQNLDMAKDTVPGISLKKAYTELLSKKHSSTVLVAVIDGGFDTAHQALRPVLWNNPTEIQGNNIDDDQNGLTDDYHGWNFIGKKDQNVVYDNIELTRLIRKKWPFYDSLSYVSVPSNLQQQYRLYREMYKIYQGQYANAKKTVQSIEEVNTVLEEITNGIGNPNPTIDAFRQYKPKNEEQQKISDAIIKELPHYHSFLEFKQQRIDSYYTHFKELVDYHYNLNYDPRDSLVGDNYEDTHDNRYGNNDVKGPNCLHGTHVAGIIAAIKVGQTEMQGIANNVKIIPIRIVPNGDERDKDVANAIRYAVNAGAKIINMSFGKPYSSNKLIVDDAVRYAMSKGVLIIHAAGNDTKDLDNAANYPNRKYENSTEIAQAWIEVGASGRKNDSTLIASFSNYGAHSVDIFAPGVSILSTVPDAKYSSLDGTSMAAPIVTGIAALIWEYYPTLSAVQVKSIILQSAFKISHSVLVKDNDGNTINLPFSQTCIAGGIVNAYEALKLALIIANK
jgi:subtilisin family serine protease